MDFCPRNSQNNSKLRKLKRSSFHIFLGVLWVFFCLFPNLLFCEIVTNIPVDDNINRILNRFEVKGYLDVSLGNSRPIPREKAVEAISTIIEKQKKGEISVTKLEEELLRDLCREFYWELQAAGIKVDEFQPARHIYRWKQGKNEANFDGIGSLKFIYNSGDSHEEDEKVLQTTVGGVLRGAILQGNLGFYAKSYQTREDGTGSYAESDEPTQEGYIQYYGNYAYFDRTDAYITFRFPWIEQPNSFRLEMGKEPIVWGTGYRGNLALSENPESFNLIKIRGNYGRLSFESFTGFLKSDIVDTLRSYDAGDKRRTIYRTKYIAGHRFEANLLRGIDVGVYEIAIYGDRSLDVGYLTPIMFYRSYEHNNNDMDNMAVGGDFRLRFLPNTEIYGEFFIDDWYLAKITTDWWGNKLGYLGGAYIIEPFGIENADFRFEYTQIEPWVYTHFYPINTYTTDNQIIGHWIGPNACSFYTEANYLQSSRLDFRLYWEFLRFGEDEGGGDVFRIHSDEVDGESAHFLSGIVEEHQKIGGRVHYEMIEDFADVVFSGNWIHRKNINSIKGISKSDFEFNLLFDFNW